MLANATPIPDDILAEITDTLATALNIAAEVTGQIDDTHAALDGARKWYSMLPATSAVGRLHDAKVRLADAIDHVHGTYGSVVGA